MYYDREIHSIGQKKPTSFGLYDMASSIGSHLKPGYDRNGRIISLHVASTDPLNYGSLSCGSDTIGYGDDGRMWASSIDALQKRWRKLGLRLAADKVADSIWEVAERDKIKQKFAAQHAEEARKAELVVAEAAQQAVSNLVSNMVKIPNKNFALCKYEVTQALWFAVMRENPSSFKGADRPVENISWNDCRKFVTKLNRLPELKNSGYTFRLPTEEEWKYACLAGASGVYCKLADGTEITEDSLKDVAWCSGVSSIQTHPVGKKKPNAFGLYDVLGNVEEWTSTKYKD